MYFKKLELIGFKSFLEKTKLHFEPGVTAIVGPNGCGKSNIADSIKWAFGEQAPKSLRASRMEDIIFNGTDQKEPINLAEVSITLSNESRILPIEYDEVTITRRLFRSGDSEYLLNKTPVRLKDIQELLMGTGIGTESYSLIEQGQIDLILSSRPEERRYIFEEASGITKYKSKKKEALNKLAQTENNLVRISDIISEVKRQIGSIERQAKKAEKYKDEFEKLKEIDTKFSFFNYKNLKNEEKIISVEISDLKRKEQELTVKIAHFNEVTEKLKSDLELISDKFSSLQATMLEASSSVDKNSHKILMNKERVKELEQLSLLLTEEIKKAEDRRASFDDSLKVLKAKVANFTKDKEAREALISQIEGNHSNLLKEVETHQRDINDSKGKTVENLAKQSKLNNELTRLTAEIQNRSSRLRRLQMEEEKVKEELNSLKDGFAQIDKEAKQAEEGLSDFNKERQSRQDELDRHNEKLGKLNKDLADSQKEISLLKSRLQFLGELVESYEGFDKGVRYILEAKKKGMFLNVDGPICDIVDFENEFEVALELALGGELQSFIVKSRKEARELLSDLEAKNMGRISIIIRDDLPKTAATKPIAKFSLMPLTEVVKARAEHKEVLDYLLKDIYITQKKNEDIFDAINRLAPGARIITMDGELLQRGRVCGGAAQRSKDTSLLGREKKIQQVHAKMKEHDKKFDQLKEAVKKEEHVIISLGSDIKNIDLRMHAQEITLANINTRKQGVEAQLNRLNDEQTVLNTEVKELKELMQELTDRQESFKADFKASQEEHLSLENLIISSQDSIENKSKQKEELLIQLTQYRTEVASLVREERGLLESLTREQSGFSELCSSIEAKSKQLLDGTDRIKELDEENESLEKQNSKNSSVKEKLEEDIEKIREEKAHLMEEIAKEDHKARGEKSSYDQIRENLHELEMKKAEFSYKQTSLREKVLQSYKIDLEQAQISIDEGTDWEEIKIDIEELKAKLEKMGTVNLVAIEEHQELQERFNFLTHQQEDLLNAKDSLMKAIQKINKTTRSLFMDTFTKIQAQFRDFFRLLFGGGQAELLLLDEKDVLESGIEIIVRPPGKKLQNISLLSGGEKSLTAIALLFAIFKVKPSPFCVLDEMDAALDESNIGRFSNVLKDFIRSSQFIIITHNKKTIELADVMYGITMEESGVSKIVSVKFADAEKEKKKAEVLA